MNKVIFSLFAFSLLICQMARGQSDDCVPFPDPVEIIGIAERDGKVYTWFKNGKVSIGVHGDLDRDHPMEDYTMPLILPSPTSAKKTPSDIVGIASTKGRPDMEFIYWFSDGTLTIGTHKILDKYSEPGTDKKWWTYSLPDGYLTNDIIEISNSQDENIFTTEDYFYNTRLATYFKDGKVCFGTPLELGGSLFDQSFPLPEHTLPSGKNMSDIVGISVDESSYFSHGVHYYFNNGIHTRGTHFNSQDVVFGQLGSYIRYYLPKDPLSQLRAMPRTVEEANEEFPERKKKLIIAWVRFCADSLRLTGPFFPKWENNGNAQYALSMIGSIFYMLGHPSEFKNDEEWEEALYELKIYIKTRLREKMKEIHNSKNPDNPVDDSYYDARSDLENFQEAVKLYFESIKPYAVMGTQLSTCSEEFPGNYDMALVNLADFLYTYRDMKSEDNKYLLTNDIIYLAIVNSTKKIELTIEWSPGVFCSIKYDPHHYIFDFEKKMSVIGAIMPKNLYEDENLKKLVLYCPADLIAGEPTVWWNDETENHVLLEYTWNYLMTNWIMWQGSLMPGDDRYDERVTEILLSNNNYVFKWLNTDYQNWWVDRVLQIVGRTVHNGLFETNARPYQSIYLNALLTLAAHADAASVMPFSDRSNHIIPTYAQLPLQEKFAGDKARVAQGARNALYTIAAKYAFQSFEGKRSPPMRREYDKQYSAGFYQKDGLVDIFGTLTGAYVCSECRYYYRDIYHNGVDAFWAAITESSLPRVPIPYAIHDFMLNKHGGYFARVQDYYTNDHYSLGGQKATDFSSPRYFHPNVMPWTNNTLYPPYKSGLPEGSPEFYFCTDDYLLSAGGKFSLYFNKHAAPEEIWSYDEEAAYRVYDFFSKPTILITKGDIGGKHWETGDGDRYLNIDTAQEEVLLLLGDSMKFAFSNNLWVYKNFVYGYEHQKDISEAEGYFKGWPQLYPKAWNQFVYMPEGVNDPVFEVGEGGYFKVFNFTQQNAKNHPMEGYYVIMGKFVKDVSDYNKNLKKHYTEFRRGFVEIVPGYLYPKPQSLVDAIVKRNETEPNGGNFNLDPELPVSYVTATTDERLLLCPTLGTYERGTCEFKCLVFLPKCEQGILQIEKRALNGGWLPPEPLDKYINITDDAAMRKIPLITVWGQILGRDGEGSENCMYAESPESGHIYIRNPYISCSDDSLKSPFIEIDSRNYFKPKFDHFGECSADLNLVEIVTRSYPHYAGTPIKVQIIIKNESDLWAEPTKAKLQVKGTAIYSISDIPGLNPKETYFSTTHIVVPRQGTFTLVGTIDYQNATLDNDKGNNVRTQIIQVGPSEDIIKCISDCPDLVISLKPEGPESGPVIPDADHSNILDSNNDLVFIVKNIGNSVAGTFETQVKFDRFDRAIGRGAKINTPFLLPGEEKELRFIIPAGCRGTRRCSFTAKVDVKNHLQEVKEDNNELRGSVRD